MADLKVNGMASRTSLMVDDDALLILDHSSTSDRVRRILHESMESVIVWGGRPWPAIILVALIFGGITALPLMAYLADGDETNMMTAIFFLLILAAIETVLLMRRNFELVINHGGEQYRTNVTVSSRTMRKFIAKLTAQAEKAQREIREKRDHGVSEQDDLLIT